MPRKEVRSMGGRVSYELSIEKVILVKFFFPFSSRPRSRLNEQRGGVRGTVNLEHTEPDQKYEQTEYPRMFDSAAVVRLHEMLPLYWHSEKREYTGGWQTQDA